MTGDGGEWASPSLFLGQHFLGARAVSEACW